MRSSLLAVAALLVGWLALAQNFPQPGPGIQGFGGSADPYASAIAIWTFNEANSLGMEGNDSLASGAMLLENDYTVRASHADAASLSGGTGVSFTYCTWADMDAQSDDDTYGGKDDYSTQREWVFRNAGAIPTLYANHTCAGAGQVTAAAPTSISTGVVTFVCAEYDGSTRKGKVYKDGSFGTESGALPAEMCDGTADFYVGAYVFGDGMEAALGPVYWWRGTAVSEATLDTLYNNGFGYNCASAIAIDSSMTHCWDLDEVGTGVGSYKDEMVSGALDLDAVNSPARQTPGLVGALDQTYGLTPVNTPTATGGALGYAAHFAVASTQYATGGDVFDSGDGVSWGFAAWMIVTTDAVNKQFVSKLSGSNNGHWDGYYSTGNGNWICRLHDGTSLKDDSDASLTALNTRELVMCRYNATTNALEAGVDGTFTGSPTTTLADGADTAVPFNVNAANNTPTGTVDAGPIMFWRSASGGEVLTDAIATSVYNSGKGKTCADLTAAEQVNLVSCWDMDEDGGPYADSIGSNDLTAVNTPTQAAGLVERSDSGMGVQNLNADTSYLRSTDSALHPSTAMTVCSWMKTLGTGGTQFVSVRSGGAHDLAMAMWDGGATAYTLAKGYNPTDGWVSTGGYSDSNRTKGEWALVCGQRDLTEVRVYTNGGNQHAASGSLPNGFNGSAPDQFDIGVSDSAVIQDGINDNVAFWLRALTTDEMDTLYNSGAGYFYAALDLRELLQGSDRPRFAWSVFPEKKLYLR